MAGVAVSTPLTIQQKIEKAWDQIDGILNSSVTVPITTFDEFMKIYSGASGLGVFIDNLFLNHPTTPRSKRPITADEVKSHLFTALSDIHAKSKQTVARYVLHEKGRIFTLTPFMCLFIFGLIDLNTVNFSEWMKMQYPEEQDYIREFLSFITHPSTINVYLDVKNAVSVIDEHVIPHTLFLTSSIPDIQNVVILDSFPEQDPWTNLRGSLTKKDTVTSNPAFWYAYVLRNDNPTVQGSTGSGTAQAWADTSVITASPGTTASADPSTASPDTTTTKCIGVVSNGNQYIFAYNFPQYTQGETTEQVRLWRRHITEPYEKYANVFQSFTLTPYTTIISKVTLENRMLIYIHLLVMGMCGGTRNFYALGETNLPETCIQDALVAGTTCSDYLALLSHIDSSNNALGIASGAMDGAVMARLARAHLALMRKNPYFTFQGDITEDFKDELDSTCPVKYQWVFQNKNLSLHQEWVTQVTADIDLIEKGTNTTKTDLGVFRRIAHFMSPNFELGVNPTRSVLQKFIKVVDVGAKVDKNVNKRIVLDLEDFCNKRKIFSASSTLNEFLIDNPSIPQLKVAMQKYFTVPWHPDDVFGKYIVRDSSDDTYEVRDSVQMEIDNTDHDLSGDVTERAERTPSGSSGTSSNASYDPDGIFPPIDGAWNAAGQAKKGAVKHLPLINELDEVIKTEQHEIHRSEGGLAKILESLEALKKMKGISTEEGKKEVEAVQQKVAAASAAFTKEFGALKTDVDDLKAELQKSHGEAEAQKLKFEGEMKKEHEKNANQALQLADAMKRQADCIKQKVADDAEIQKLTEERDDLAGKLVALTTELADSNAREKIHEGTIVKLQDDMKSLEAEIVTHKQEIADLNVIKAKSLASDTSRLAEIAELADAKAKLAAEMTRAAQLELDKQKLEADKQALGTTLSASGADLKTEHLERLKLNEDMIKLRTTIAQYELELKEIIEKVRKATLEHDKLTNGRIWQIQDKVDVQIQGEFTESQLLTWLKAGEYLKFLNAVKEKTPVKKAFNPTALFLTYESIGGTWQMFAEPALTDKGLTTALMAQKLLDDILLFQTIETHDEHIANTYTTKHFRDFMEVFGCIEFDPDTKLPIITGFSS